MTVNLKIKGLDKTIKMLQEKQKNVKKGAEGGLIKIGYITQRRVKENLTRKKIVDTGQLRRSITVNKSRVNKLAVYISADTHYAVHVEYGHRVVNGKGQQVGYVQGRYFMRDSLHEIKDELVPIMKISIVEVL